MTKSFNKIAIFYDWLYTWGGAERLLLTLLETFPNADLYTTFYDPKKTKWLPKNINIYHLKIPTFFSNKLSLLAPFIPAFLEKYSFDKYETVISMGTIFNNTLLSKPNTKLISYTLTPNRYLDKYKIYEPIDNIFSNRPDLFVSISQTVKDRILNKYKKSSTIIYPPVNTNFFLPDPKGKRDYYLIVSRLVPHKMIDQAIIACRILNKNLLIVGEGREKNKLKNIASSNQNIDFLQNVNDTQLKKIYQNCTALLAPQLEDFGLSNLECMACGRPVIGFNKGGNTETILHRKTGYLYNEQTPNALVQSIIEFEKLYLSENDCLNQAKKFSIKKFMLDWKHIIDETN